VIGLAKRRPVKVGAHFVLVGYSLILS
jgi:hypothetical protein